MREFKFRSWQGKTMHYFDFFDIMNRGFDPSGYGVFDAINMQYTGINDKNEVEIFEADIVRVVLKDGEEVFTVHYEPNRARFYFEDVYGHDWGFAHSNEMIVIGNIYENPELITNSDTSKTQ